MVYSRVSDGLSCGYSRFNPCWIKTSREDLLAPWSQRCDELIPQIHPPNEGMRRATKVGLVQKIAL